MSATGPAPGPVVLVGMPGAGKSTIGRKLARVLDVPFCDTDALIEEAEGRSIPEIFATDGEPYFRRREEEIVAQAVAAERGVVSLGGGAVLSPRTRELLREKVVIHLMISVAEGARRSQGGGRPLLAGTDVLARYQQLHTDRAGLYKEVATYATSTERRGTGRVVRDIVEHIAPELAPGVDAGEDAPGEIDEKNA